MQSRNLSFEKLEMYDIRLYRWMDRRAGIQTDTTAVLILLAGEKKKILGAKNLQTYMQVAIKRSQQYRGMSIKL